MRSGLGGGAQAFFMSTPQHHIIKETSETISQLLLEEFKTARLQARPHRRRTRPSPTPSRASCPRSACTSTSSAWIPYGVAGQPHVPGGPPAREPRRLDRRGRARRRRCGCASTTSSRAGRRRRRTSSCCSGSRSAPCIDNPCVKASAAWASFAFEPEFILPFTLSARLDEGTLARFWGSLNQPVRPAIQCWTSVPILPGEGRTVQARERTRSSIPQLSSTPTVKEQGPAARTRCAVGGNPRPERRSQLTTGLRPVSPRGGDQLQNPGAPVSNTTTHRTKEVLAWPPATCLQVSTSKKSIAAPSPSRPSAPTPSGSSASRPRARLNEAVLFTNWSQFVKTFGDFKQCSDPPRARRLRVLQQRRLALLRRQRRRAVEQPAAKAAAPAGDKKGEQGARRGGAGPAAVGREALYIGKDDGPGRASGLKCFEDIDEISLVAAPGQTSPAVPGRDPLALREPQGSLRDPRLRPSRSQGGVDKLAESARLEVRRVLLPVDPGLRSRRRATSTCRRRVTWPASTPASTTSAASTRRRRTRSSVARSACKLQHLQGRAGPAQPEGHQLHPLHERRGIRIWGARTLSTRPVLALHQRPPPVHHGGASIERATQWVVFEPNDHTPLEARQRDDHRRS